MDTTTKDQSLRSRAMQEYLTEQEEADRQKHLSVEYHHREVLSLFLKRLSEMFGDRWKSVSTVSYQGPLTMASSYFVTVDANLGSDHAIRFALVRPDRWMEDEDDPMDYEVRVEGKCSKCGKDGLSFAPVYDLQSLGMVLSRSNSFDHRSGCSDQERAVAKLREPKSPTLAEELLAVINRIIDARHSSAPHAEY